MDDPTPLGQVLDAQVLKAKAAAVAARGVELGKVKPSGSPADDAPPEPTAEEEAKASQRAARAKVWADLVPAAYGSPKLADLIAEVRAPVAEWSSAVLDRRFVNLLLTGPVGTGKSHAAYAAVRAAVGAGRRVAGYSVAALLEDLRPSEDPEVEARARVARRRVEGAELLILDDVGAEKASEWTTERIGVIVHLRWERRLPTIITTNLLPAGLEEVLGARTYSRFVDEYIPVVIRGADRRKATTP